MKTPKREINILDKDLLFEILKKRDSAQSMADISKFTRNFGFILTVTGLLAKEPISATLGLMTATISGLIKLLASKNADKHEKDLQNLCGNQYIIVGKGKKSEIINLNDQDFEQEK